MSYKTADFNSPVFPASSPSTSTASTKTTAPSSTFTHRASALLSIQEEADTPSLLEKVRSETIQKICTQYACIKSLQNQISQLKNPPIREKLKNKWVIDYIENTSWQKKPFNLKNLESFLEDCNLNEGLTAGDIPTIKKKIEELETLKKENIDDCTQRILDKKLTFLKDPLENFEHIFNKQEQKLNERLQENLKNYYSHLFKTPLQRSRNFALAESLIQQERKKKKISTKNTKQIGPLIKWGLKKALKTVGTGGIYAGKKLYQTYQEHKAKKMWKKHQEEITERPIPTPFDSPELARRIDKHFPWIEKKDSELAKVLAHLKEEKASS